ncbi:2-keto-4-pentenoate hydratase/2-oxohepta-3-ene-1,7-dioic acid hydratase (catechol pathway) [Hahella chejuensis KCTC 2396]|uniref:2-keto-4-pentenoate hydratase/2-oxohepta-3-ene-1,7-dioic acid hydratase (Catechol pathway) n=1 Tax=Hahella chejuensis (strain KCTC 2396) TaxID=349521 RepID=Q2SND3_HAHCH|nr:fumarylacetoacetate hydrolase family protein [Hahella chejuensis]ABC27841.1 2-keto-4-pentenoate hydratase/2-oxohepta-3-ene-1,7-dioic acid hydratase (catechol pathway) [Hahella chejuensis KCTC 2396]
MKFATLKSNSRDGVLVVVSRDLQQAVAVPQIAPTLQAALDQWNDLSSALEEVYSALNKGSAKEAFAFDPSQCASPLPRAYQWADGSAYVNHVELVRKARGAEMPESFWTDPLMYQGGSDAFLGPREDIAMASEDWGIDMEAEVAVITDDVRMGATPEDAGKHIRLLMLVNDVSLRNLIPGELAKGFGFFQSKPSSAFSPVAVTPDELGDAWDGGKVHLPLITHLNDTLLGQPNAGIDMTFDFPTLIAHAAKTRPLSAGAIVGSGTVSNKDRSTGSSCLAEVRMLEIIESGSPKTPFMRFGDQVRIEMLDKQGRSIFGAIDQKVTRYS